MPRPQPYRLDWSGPQNPEAISEQLGTVVSHADEMFQVVFEELQALSDTLDGLDPIIDLTSGVTGILPIANGGTNSADSPTLGGVAYGDGSALKWTAAGVAAQVLTSNGAAAPTWQDPAVTTSIAKVMTRVILGT